MTLAISFTRRADSEPFDDERVEVYARCRARGVTMKRACEEADIAKASAQKIEADDRYQKRLRELKDAAQQFTGVTLAAIMQRLLRNVDDAHAAGDFKASNQALSQLTVLVKQDAGRVTGALANVGARQSDKKTREGFRAMLSQPETVDTTGESTEPEAQP